MKRLVQALAGLALSFLAVLAVPTALKRRLSNSLRDFTLYEIIAPVIRWVAVGLAGVVVIVAGFLIYFFFVGFHEKVPDQPIYFWHSTHAQGNQIPCLYCHQYASKSSIAGIPSVETCIGCHRVVIPQNPEVEKVFGYWQRQEPIPWARVTYLPDFVYFTHDRHVNSGLGCLDCHKPNASNDLTEPVWFQDRFKPAMGWCIDCHTARQVSIDCYTCHR
ncbi:MAG: cytochrome c family protein [Chloroflexi bacterium]|nr:cytochrome c family protein [Chloroflexota bacterium]